VIVALTANATSEDEAACRNAGMNDFLSKPINNKHLEAMLLKYISKSKIEKKSA
jgi:CheY-like chemotaxis protein